MYFRTVLIGTEALQIYSCFITDITHSFQVSVNAFKHLNLRYMHNNKYAEFDPNIPRGSRGISMFTY